MSRPSFIPYDRYVGNGALDEYSSTFTVTAKSQLEVVVYNASGVEQFRVDGDDAVSIASTTINSDGTITVTLNAVLTSGYVIFLLLAHDAPTQPSEWRNKSIFKLATLEAAFDFLTGPIQRAIYLAKRSVRLPDFITSGFDPTLPSDINTADRSIVTNASGDGFILGPTTTEIANAQTYAEAASAAQGFAEDAQAAAEAAQSAAEDAQIAAENAAAVSNAWSAYVPHAITDAQAATDLTDETLDIATYSSAHYMFEIIRGTTVIANGDFAVQDLNGTGRVVMGQSISSTPHGVTLSVSQVGTVVQLRAALNAGAGNGFISLSKRLIPA